jgi:integrase
MAEPVRHRQTKGAATDMFDLTRPRHTPTLPKIIVLSPEEVGRLLASATNIKHKALLSLAYATGLRASEVVSLKLSDIARDRVVIRVEQGKGKKDRYVILPPHLLKLLREWTPASVNLLTPVTGRRPKTLYESESGCPRI